ncbi:MAG: c-type cytochrome [Magnetococcus sp. YQC-3]
MSNDDRQFASENERTGEMNKSGWMGICLGILLLWSATAWAEVELSEPYLLALGGRLYDNWSVVLNIKPPKATHPSYPATGSKKGAGTWRCKECHGWDYLGKDGRYATGEHATGIRGIQAWKGREPADVVALLRSATHGYTPEMLPDAAAHALGLFVAKGQIDFSPLLDAQGKAKGDPKRGVLLYQTICAFCHGLDGKKINFGSDKEPEYMGTAARENPWEAMHKMRNGQPAKEMLSLRMLPDMEMAHILAFEQTLPEK